ncbi:hypothetical protein [Neisseria leonii]|uniref:hypothetical protein n=1 Tax=Neisseria leonii TaxID=2995413 RepID=UPI00237AFDBE|nr:hypothetical protein [Neisseria sp. 3986]MDD9326006.1 hypothetical protein [Neisseria sp. 3986]
MKKSIFTAFSCMAGLLLLSCQSGKNGTQTDIKETGRITQDTAETGIKDQAEYLKEYLKKKKLSGEELMKTAKERGIPYRKEENGAVYELQGFDGKGMPLYYSTMPASPRFQIEKGTVKIQKTDKMQ